MRLIYVFKRNEDTKEKKATKKDQKGQTKTDGKPHIKC